MMKTTVGMNLAGLHSDGGDVSKAISSHRLFIEHCGRVEVTALYLNRVSHNFCQCGEYEYTIEVLKEFMDVTETVEEEDKDSLRSRLLEAYLECNECLKAKALNEKLRLMGTDLTNRYSSVKIEAGMCNYEGAIGPFRKVYAELQSQEFHCVSSIYLFCRFVNISPKTLCR